MTARREAFVAVVLVSVLGAGREAEAQFIDFGYCGDGLCLGIEDCSSCTGDCGVCPSCGDGACNGAEDCGTCAGDCGACPACAPWFRTVTRSGAFTGDFVSASAYAFARVGGGDGTIANVVDVSSDATLFGHYQPLLHIRSHGDSNGAAASGVVSARFVGFDLSTRRPRRLAAWSTGPGRT